MQICDISIQFPIARECLKCLHGPDAIKRIAPAIDLKTTDINDVQDLTILRDRCSLALEENNVYFFWREFFLSGDIYGRDKTFLQMLSYLRHQQLSFICTRSLAHLLRRPQPRYSTDLVAISNDISEDAWTELLYLLVQVLESRDWRKDPEGYDKLIQSGLERATSTLGRLSSDFIDKGSILMQLVSLLHTPSLRGFFPRSVEFSSILVAEANWLWMRRST